MLNIREEKPKNSCLDQDCDYWLEKGKSCYQKKELIDAIECYNLAIKIKPDYADTYYNKGNALDDLGRKEEAIECYDAVIRINPVYADAYYNKGSVLWDLKKKEEAIECYDAAIRIKPDWACPYFDKGFVLSSLGRKEAAIECYDEAIKIKPDYFITYNSKGNALSLLGRIEEAIECYDSAIKTKPDYAEAYYNKGNAFWDLEQKQEAIECYDTAIKLKPDYADAYFGKGFALSTLGRKEEAIECYDAVLKIKPKDSTTYNNKGSVLSDLGRKEEAIECFEAAIKIKPDYALSYFNKGNVLSDLRRKEEAIECFEATIKIIPDYALSCNEGNVLSDLEIKELAIEFYDEAIRNKTDNDLVIFDEKQPKLCPICDTHLNEVNQIIIPSCFHIFCNSCITTYITLRVQNSQANKMPCPQHTCKDEIPIDIIKAVLTPEFFEKYQKFKRIEELNRNPNLRWCPVADCEGYDLGSTAKRQLTCNKCGYNYCYYCSEAWHEDSACKGQTDFIFDNWSKKNGVKFCPSCTRRVQKNDGCDHMTCTVCKHEWCWLCGEKYHPTHYDICKVRKFQEINPEWTLVLLLIFCIPISPFFFIFFCLSEYYYTPKEQSMFVISLIYIGAFIFSLLLTPFMGIGALLYLGYVWLNDLCFRFFNVSSRLLKWINGLLSILLSPIFVCVIIIILIGMTFVGFYKAFVKISFFIKKRNNPDYMKSMDNYANF